MMELDARQYEMIANLDSLESQTKSLLMAMHTDLASPQGGGLFKRCQFVSLAALTSVALMACSVVILSCENSECHAESAIIVDWQLTDPLAHHVEVSRIEGDSILFSLAEAISGPEMTDVVVIWWWESWEPDDHADGCSVGFSYEFDPCQDPALRDAESPVVVYALVTRSADDAALPCWSHAPADEGVVVFWVVELLDFCAPWPSY